MISRSSIVLLLLLLLAWVAYWVGGSALADTMARQPHLANSRLAAEKIPDLSLFLKPRMREVLIGASFFGLSALILRGAVRMTSSVSRNRRWLLLTSLALALVQGGMILMGKSAIFWMAMAGRAEPQPGPVPI